MFKNPGSGVKVFSIVIFVLGCIASGLILLAGVMSSTFIPMLLLAVVVFLGVFLQSLFLCAFGELVESNTKTQQSNQEILSKLEQINENQSRIAQMLRPDLDPAVQYSEPVQNEYGY